MKKIFSKNQWIGVASIITAVVGWFFASNKIINNQEANSSNSKIIQQQNVNGDNNYTEINLDNSKIADLPGASLSEKVRNYLDTINPEITLKLKSDNLAHVALTGSEIKPLQSIKERLLSENILDIISDNNFFQAGAGNKEYYIFNKIESLEPANGFTFKALSNFNK